MSHESKIEAEIENPELLIVHLLNGCIFKLAIEKIIKLAGLIRCNGAGEASLADYCNSN